MAESLWGLPYRLLHCGISAPSADGIMAEMGPCPEMLKSSTSATEPASHAAPGGLE
jgi:hypothetical protein